MNAHTSLPLAVLVFALATPAYALTLEQSLTANDQKATVKSSTSKKSAGQSKSKKAEPVVFDGVRLLTPEDDLQGNINIAELTNLIVNVEILAKKIFAANKQPGTILLSFTATPVAQDVKLAFQPSELAPQKLLQQLIDAIGGLNRLNVNSSEVKFVVQFTLNP